MFHTVIHPLSSPRLTSFQFFRLDIFSMGHACLNLLYKTEIGLARGIVIITILITVIVVVVTLVCTPLSSLLLDSHQLTTVRFHQQPRM